MSASSSHQEIDAWVIASAPRALAYARSLLDDLHQAEDVVQDCYVRLLAKTEHYDLGRDGTKLLFRSITNACINIRTRRKPLFRLVRHDETGVEQPDDPEDTRSPPADALAMGNELAEKIEWGLNQLPPQQRAAIQLKSLGYSQQEIAEMLGITYSHAGVLIHRARQTMSTLLSSHLGEEASLESEQ